MIGDAGRAGAADASGSAALPEPQESAPAEPPERRIVGFDRDEEGHWVAELECGHGQHVRHDPPWQSRAWVTSEAGRARMLGVMLRCRKCLSD